MVRSWQPWALALCLLTGCGPHAVLGTANGLGATAPENIPLLGGGPKTADRPLEGSVTTDFSGGLLPPTGSVTPTGSTTGTLPGGPTQNVTPTETTDLGMFGDKGPFKRPAYKPGPGEVVVYIPEDAAEYAQVLQRLVSEGIPINQAVAGAIAHAQSVSPKFGKIVGEITQLNPNLLSALSQAQKEVKDGQPKLTVIQVERK